MATVTESTDETGGSNLQISVAVLFGAVLALVGLAAPVLSGPNGNNVIEGNFIGVDSVSKVLLALVMIMGRLEIFTIFVLLTPAFWRQ